LRQFNSQIAFMFNLKHKFQSVCCVREQKFQLENETKTMNLLPSLLLVFVGLMARSVSGDCGIPARLNIWNDDCEGDIEEFDVSFRLSYNEILDNLANHGEDVTDLYIENTANNGDTFLASGQDGGYHTRRADWNTRKLLRAQFFDHMGDEKRAQQERELGSICDSPSSCYNYSWCCNVCTWLSRCSRRRERRGLKGVKKAPKAVEQRTRRLPKKIIDSETLGDDRTVGQKICDFVFSQNFEGKGCLEKAGWWCDVLDA
jgi:hypothetical protein